MSQHLATGWPNERNMHVALNNVAICCFDMLRSFAWGLRGPESSELCVDAKKVHRDNYTKAYTRVGFFEETIN